MPIPGEEIRLRLDEFVARWRDYSGTERAEAQSFLTNAAATQQQFLIDRRRYAGSLAALNVSPPADLSGKYTFAVATANGPPPTFSLTATATGQQAQDACPTLAVDSSGSKSPDKCW